jgi:hypothetical protein
MSLLVTTLCLANSKFAWHIGILAAVLNDNNKYDINNERQSPFRLINAAVARTFPRWCALGPHVNNMSKMLNLHLVVCL